MIDKPDWRNRRCGDGWQSDGGDCRLPLGHAGAHESNKPDWLAEARTLCDAATPGPWLHEGNGGVGAGHRTTQVAIARCWNCKLSDSLAAYREARR